MKETPDVRLLVRWLGPQAAQTAIQESKIWTIELLRRTAEDLKLNIPEKTARKELVSQVVKAANKRIDKSLKDLYGMEAVELENYLMGIGVESEELIELLKELDVTPRRESLKNLIQFVARELSETGRFMRIASKSSDQI